MSTSLPAPTGNSAIDGLAERIARRDVPVAERNPHRFEPAWVRARLAAALAPLAPRRNRRGRDMLAAMCHAFVEHEALTAAELGAAAGVERIAGGRALGELVRIGLLSRAYEGGRRRRYRLTRFGEDWLLALARCETPPPPPAG